jgi:hypothetical protein
MSFSDVGRQFLMSEIKEGMEETGESMHAGAKAAGKKMTNPSTDAEAEYRAEKAD